MTTEPSELSDAELHARAHAWRRQALQGVAHARGHAHEHEVEVRRRLGVATTMSPPLEGEREHLHRRPFWRFW